MIVTNWENFSERVDEITSQTPYEYVKKTVHNLKRELYDNRDLIALCAPQIGENLRLFVVKHGKQDKDRFKVFLNPMLVSSEGLHLSREWNPSFPDKQFIVPRNDKIHVAYQITDGHITSETFTGAYAEIVQQMIDMLDGISLIELSNFGGALILENEEEIAAWDNSTDEEKTQILDLFVQKLKSNSDKFQKEIKEDPELSTINKTIDFMSGLLDGSITPIDDEGNLVTPEYISEKAKKIAKEQVEEMKKSLEENKEVVE